MKCLLLTIKVKIPFWTLVLFLPKHHFQQLNWPDLSSVESVFTLSHSHVDPSLTILIYSHWHFPLYSATKIIAMHHIIPSIFTFFFHLISVVINCAAETNNPQILAAYILLHVELPIQSGSIPHVFILRPKLKEQPLSGPTICMVVRTQRAGWNLWYFLKLLLRCGVLDDCQIMSHG